MNISNETKAFICHDAMRHYDIEYSEISFIRHSENLTFRVFSKSKAESYLLRIHYPLSGIIDKKWHDEKAINSELLWLQSLSKSTDILVQVPVMNKSGKLVSTIKHGENEIFCTLLTWIEGTVRYESDEYNTAQVENLGSLSAKLHNHGANWKLPENFSRPAQDYNSILDNFKKLVKRNQELNIFDKNSEVMIKKAIEKIGKCYESERVNGNWGLIHGDLCENNYILHENTVSPIDFSLCGFGSFSQDITNSLLHIFREDLWKSYFAGYKKHRSLPDNMKDSIEAFFISTQIDSWGFHCTDPKEEDWLRGSINACMNNYIPPFLKDESYIFSRFTSIEVL
jgi:Ser/Thr protein kinase RdoA (MazF antagonist)